MIPTCVALLRRPVLLSIVLPAVLLAGCGGPPPAPPTIVNATLAAAADANGSAPVSVRVYQLASPAAFEGAQFFQLFNNDQAVLKDDLVKRDELLLPPGQSKTLTLMPPDRAKAIGMLAAYRDYEHVTWRGLATIPPNKTSALKVGVDATGVTVTIEPAKP